MQLIERLVRDSGLAVLFISHDLGVVARLCKPSGRAVCRRSR